MNIDIHFETVQDKEGKFGAQMRTNILKTFLVMVMIMAMTPGANAYDFFLDGLYYSILSEDDCTVEVSSRSNNSGNNNYIEGDLTIPETIVHNSTRYTVTTIGYQAFWNRSNLTGVTIPNSVTTIALMAFQSCSSLTSVTIPSSVTTIGNYAFSGCSGLTEINVDVENPNFMSEDGIVYSKDKTSLLIWPGGKKEAIIPNSVTEIGRMAFYGCDGLSSVTIPNSVTTIGFQAFMGCSGLSSVTIPNSVTSIGDYAFAYCSGLSSVTIPNSVTTIGAFAFANCSGLSSVSLSNTLTEIGFGSFYCCYELTDVTIPNSVTSIGGNAFNGCSLTNVTIPNSVTAIGGNAFSGFLTSVTIPSSVIEMDGNVFSSCTGLTEINVDVENPNFTSEDGIVYTKDKTSLLMCPAGKKGEVSIPNTVTKICNGAFNGCSLTSVTIPNSVTTIGNSAFSGSDLTSVTIPNSVTSIGNSAFEYCYELTSVTIPNSVTTIDDWTFYHCSSLSSITIPNSVTEIGYYAFIYCSSLTSVTISNSVTEIGGSAFEGCSSLTSITIPSSVTKIGNEAFSDCSSLESVYCQWTDPIECNPQFPDVVIKNAALYVPKGAIGNYEKVDPWKNFLNIKEMEYMAGVEDAFGGDDVDVKVVGSDIVAEGCAEMEVYSMSGQLVYRGAGRAENLAAGIYVVRVADKTLKVMVAR